jgi:hypothetical protein
MSSGQETRTFRLAGIGIDVRIAAALLVRLTAGAGNRSAAHRRRLASGSFPLVLALEISPPYWKAAGEW